MGNEMASTRWFEDFAVGDVAEFGDYAVSEEEIVGFAAK